MKKDSRDLKVRGNAVAQTTAPLTPPPTVGGQRADKFRQFTQLVLDFGRAQLDGSPTVSQTQH